MSEAPVRPITVLNCNQVSYLRGGAERYFLNLSKLLTKKGFNVVNMVGQDPLNGALPENTVEVEAANFNAPKLNDALQFIYNRNAQLKIREIFSEQKIDLIHIHTFYGKLTASIIREAKRLKIPTVHTVHDVKLFCPVYTFFRDGHNCFECAETKSFLPLLKHSCNRHSKLRSALSFTESQVSKWAGFPTDIDFFITPSLYMKNTLIKYGISENKVEAIPNYVTDIADEPQEVSDYFLYFGRLETYKGVSFLIDAFARMPHRKLLVIGKGSLEQEISDRIKKTPNIQLLGHMPFNKLSSYIAKAQATIVPSTLNENFPFASLESIALGTPVLGANGGGLPEQIIPENLGLVFKPSSSDEICQAVENFEKLGLAEKSQMRARAISTVKKNYTEALHLQKLLNVYNKALGQNKII